ncbi:MAG: hypothetical protein PHD10_03000 [Bacilli bacterium]|nr:hypothetical protein [Bacilli bacterium]MDD4608079.1 hypothetical protein [Bacilli bacterium]
MKIISKIKIHIFFYLVAFLAVLTGLFKDFIILSSIIIIHELGHVLGALYFKWKIDKIIILPFGGLTVFNEKINRSMKEEFIILVLGPIFQIIYALTLNSEIFNNYHYAILLFNLLPIHPLDGSKLFNLFINKLFPFKLSHLFTIILSFIVIWITFFYRINLLSILILLFLFINVVKELKIHQYLFNRFLLERYFYHFNFKKNKIIKGNDLHKMYRDYKHLFYDGEKYRSEREILRKTFDNKVKL